MKVTGQVDLSIRETIVTKQFIFFPDRVQVRKTPFLYSHH